MSERLEGERPGRATPFRFTQSSFTQSWFTQSWFTQSWYTSVISAALSYHLGGFILMVLQLSGRGEWSRFPWIYLDVMQALAFLALGAVCRILSSSVFRSSDSASRVVWGDICVVVLAIAGVSAIALPLDSSGAFLLALILIVPWALPFAALLSGLSILAQRYVWLQIVLTAVLMINVALLLVGLAAGTAAP